MPPLERSDLDSDPIAQFAAWFAEATRNQPGLPEGMTLATVDHDGRPAARVVLLKGFDDRGFVFFTNYRSRKARELDHNPHAALCFWWPALERQVRIEGSVARVDDAESDAYFATRPRGSQIGAWASDQSAVLESRESLEREAARIATRYAGAEIPRPPHWGGYRLTPGSIEFWQNRDDRLHDRFRYTRAAGGWTLERLAP